jgi:hypothetical protein
VSANNDSASRTSNPSSVQKFSGKKATSEQQYTGQGAQEAPDVAGGVGNPDIDFSASVKARELHFEEESQTPRQYPDSATKGIVALTKVGIDSYKQRVTQIRHRCQSA